jgi:hypothetical protein
MMALLGLGTYRCRDVTTAARAAVAAGVTTIDTAPVYAHGTAQLQLARVLATHPEVQISSKVGHMTRTQAQAALRAGPAQPRARRPQRSPPTSPPDHTSLRNLRKSRSRRQNRRLWRCHLERLHPRRFHSAWPPQSRARRRRRHRPPSTRDPVAGESRPHRASEALNGAGPVAEAAEAGLQVWASAPLNGGELLDMVTSELAALISPCHSPVAAAPSQRSSSKPPTATPSTPASHHESKTTSTTCWKHLPEAPRLLAPFDSPESRIRGYVQVEQHVRRGPQRNPRPSARSFSGSAEFGKVCGPRETNARRPRG